jgi:hypothetical protein
MLLATFIGRHSSKKRWFKHAVLDVASNIFLSHVTGCHFTHKTRVQNALDDVATNMCLRGLTCIG